MRPNLPTGTAGTSVPSGMQVHAQLRAIAHRYAVARLQRLQDCAALPVAAALSRALDEALPPADVPQGCDAERSHARLRLLCNPRQTLRLLRRVRLGDGGDSQQLFPLQPALALAHAEVLLECAEQAENDAARRTIALLEGLFRQPRSPSAPAAAATATVQVVVTAEGGRGSACCPPPSAEAARSRREELELYAAAVCAGAWGRTVLTRRGAERTVRGARAEFSGHRDFAELCAQRLTSCAELRRLSRRATMGYSGEQHWESDSDADAADSASSAGS